MRAVFTALDQAHNPLSMIGHFVSPSLGRLAVGALFALTHIIGQNEPKTKESKGISLQKARISHLFTVCYQQVFNSC